MKTLIIIFLMCISTSIFGQNYTVVESVKASTKRDTTIVIEGKSFKASISKKGNICVKKISSSGNERCDSVGKATNLYCNYDGKKYDIYTGKLDGIIQKWILILNKNGNPKKLTVREN